MSNFGPGWVGQTLGNRYKIEAILGRGGMSSVYRAHDPNLNRKVAVKIIHQNLTDNTEFIQRFEQEAALIAQLRHPNIVQVHDFNHDGNIYYMVMENIPGETLSHRLEALKNAGMRLPLLDTLRIMSKICSAVNYAHQRRMIHRDLKPANVMLDLLGEPYLMDFGIARLIGAPPAAAGTPLGTAAYMSPEQVRGEEADHRSDIYSLGIMLYEMLSGDPPFNGDSTYQVMIKQVSEPMPDIQAVGMNTPHSLVTILERALAKDPAGRFPTASEMGVALHTVSLQLQGPADTLATRHLDHLGLLWQQARDLFDERLWPQCMDKLAELRRADPDYQQHKADALGREVLQRLHQQADRDYAAHRFNESLAAIMTIRQYDPDFPVNELEFKVHTGIQQADLRAHLDRLYAEAVGSLEVREYETALTRWQSIQVQKENLDFPDRMMVEKRAREGSCAALYTAALVALTQHQPDVALAKLARIEEIDPAFPDSQQVAAKAGQMKNQPAAPPARRRLVWAGGLAFLFVVVVGAAVILPGQLRGQTAVSPTTTATAEATMTLVAALFTTPTETTGPSPSPSSTAAATVVPSHTPTVIPTRTPSPTLLPTETATVRPSDRAAALANVSIFAVPDADTAELAVIEAGEEVWVLGRSETGNWLYVSNVEGDRGFASAHRFDWAGDITTLPVRAPIVVVIAPTATALPSTENLLLELYQLDGTQQCSGGTWTIRIFIQGRGGNGSYNYYWNGELLAANQITNHTFVVGSGGAPIIGVGRVTSGNLSAEKELFLVKPACN